MARATLAVLLRGEPGEAYHVSTDRFISIRDLVSMVAQMAGVKFSELVEEVGDRPAKDAAYLLDASKLRESLKWSPEVELEAGVGEVVRWVDEKLAILRELPDRYVHRP